MINEYIPYQVFITGDTLFKDVYVKPSFEFIPNKKTEEISDEYIINNIKKYVNDNKIKNFISAVSGGIDSSVLALIMKPDIIYSGYYDEEGFDETEYSSLVTNAISATHYKIKLTEDDFINNFEDFTDIICIPSAGFGGVMEYVTLKKILEKVDTKDVVFGNGGDEVFMGYFYNHFIRDFAEYGNETPIYMPNWISTKKKITKNIIDMMIISALGKMDGKILISNFVRNILLPMISKIKNVKDKILFTNINFTLPSLLHLSEQTCNFLNVNSHNPFVSLVDIANSIELTKIPKEKIRRLCPEMPQLIANNYVKRGFPIPLEKWSRLEGIFRELYDNFFNRHVVILSNFKKKPFKIDRFMWGVVQSELFLRNINT